MTVPADIDAFEAQLRSQDPDGFLTARLASRTVRPALTTLYAFNADLARICDVVTEPTLGEIRLQWWRDVVERADERSETGAPLADALAETIVEYGLPKPMLLGMIDARGADLDGGGFADLQALKAYLYKIDGALFALSAHVLGAAGPQIAKAANSAGAAVGIARLLRFLPHDASAGRVMLPLSMLKRHEVHPEQILAGKESDGFRDVVSELAGEAAAALETAREHLTAAPGELRGIFAPLALVPPYLRAVTRPGRQHLHEVADINPLTRFFLLWRAARMGGI